MSLQDALITLPEDIILITKGVWYSPETGRVFSNRYSGGRSGVVRQLKRKNGYISILIAGVETYAHIVVWTLLKGPIPLGMEVDHINGDCSDHRLVNLRVVSHAENIYNTKKFRHNTSGFPGVYWDNYRNRWLAAIKVKGKFKNLGRFADKAQAYAAYIAAKHLYHGEQSIRRLPACLSTTRGEVRL